MLNDKIEFYGEMLSMRAIAVEILYKSILINFKIFMKQKKFVEK